MIKSKPRNQTFKCECAGSSLPLMKGKPAWKILFQLCVWSGWDPWLIPAHDEQQLYYRNLDQAENPYDTPLVNAMSRKQYRKIPKISPSMNKSGLLPRLVIGKLPANIK